MPAVTAMALDGLIERRSDTRLYDSRHVHRDRASSSSSSSQNPSQPVPVGGPLPSFVHHFSPALYATPEPTQIARASPDCVSPSPYVVNHKRRDFRVPVPPPSASNEVSVAPAVRDEDDGVKEKGRLEVEMEKKRELDLDDKQDRELRSLANLMQEVEMENERQLDLNDERDGEDHHLDGFFNPRDSASVMSNSDTEDVQSLGKSKRGFCNNEFYDATEDFSSDSSASHASPLRANLEADLCSVRLSMFEETERRKKVEASLTCMQNRWKNMAAHFCKLGLSFPPIPDRPNAQQQEIDPVTQVCQEIVVGRFVNEAIDRGLARAELEASSEAIIDAKNHEISRLHDRLQYYEAVNHEMSQRNQEAMELGRQKRLMRRKRQRWMWGSIGLSISIGACLLAYSYIPQTVSVGGGHNDFAETSSS